MKKSDFYYFLPNDLIAQKPLEARDSSALLEYKISTGQMLHKKFKDIVDLLDENDVLVINNTKVLPARLFGVNENNAKIEILLLKQIDRNNWEVLIKPAKKAKLNSTIIFPNNLSALIKSISSEHGTRFIEFIYNGSFEEIIDQIGHAPIPPYILENLEDRNRYQTVYAKFNGSSAAPTAGLHFTTNLLEQIKEKNVKIVEVLLHVGLGTFRPVKVEDVENHIMHEEYVKISKETAKIINKAKEQGKRIIAVGTTCVRALESFADNSGMLTFGEKNTNIFIYPPYKFKIVDALITNFHLPESTLLMLVASLTGKNEILSIYEEAIKKKYRFYSFGDAMFIHQ